MPILQDLDGLADQARQAGCEALARRIRRLRPAARQLIDTLEQQDRHILLLEAALQLEKRAVRCDRRPVLARRCPNWRLLLRNMG